MSVHTIKSADKSYKALIGEFQHQLNRVRKGLTHHRKTQETNSKDWGFIGDMADFIAKMSELADRMLGCNSKLKKTER